MTMKKNILVLVVALVAMLTVSMEGRVWAQPAD
jgi:hypothetical protein